jgi:diguanylate cyclase (GGDEF)-like protein
MGGDLPQPDRNSRDEMPGLNYKMIAVMVVDLDYFKDVNDRWGHAAGDLLLKYVADRLAEEVSDTDTVVCWGGDEFPIVLSSLNSPSDTHHIARKIVSSFCRPFRLDFVDACITTSLGAAIYPDHSQDMETFLKNAAKAMYEAKSMGRKSYCFYK